MEPTSEKKVSNNHIHEDISFSVLSKLPLKSLKRFSCACKSWALLFENPNFMSTFRNKLISNTRNDACVFLKHLQSSCDELYSMNLLSGERFQSKVKLDWKPLFREDFDDIMILGSGITGIFCLFRLDHKSVVLWNPATNQFKVVSSDLPEPPPGCSTNVILHGFGYDHVQDDYKIIRSVDFVLTQTKSQRHIKRSNPNPSWKIYSLKKNTWRNLDVSMPIRRRNKNEEGLQVYLNGVCHWLGTINKQPYVVSFNLSHEVFFTTPFPLEYVSDGFCFTCKYTQLMVLNESIAVISKDEEASSFHIYILGEVGVESSWTKVFTIGPLLCLNFPIGNGENGDIFFRKDDDWLAYFDLSTQKVEEIGVKGGHCFCHAGIYKENFLMVEGLNN